MSWEGTVTIGEFLPAFDHEAAYASAHGNNPAMTSSPFIPPTVDAALCKLRDWYGRQRVTVGILDSCAHQFDEITESQEEKWSFPLFRPREVKSSSEVRVLCETLLTYAWHFGDYIRHALQEQRGLSESEAKAIVNDHVRLSTSLQDCAYMVNTAKHASATRSWGQECGARMTQPELLAPDGFGTFCGVCGDDWSELRGTFAGPIIQTMRVEGKDGRWLQDARWHAEYAAASWLALLDRLQFDGWASDEIDDLMAGVVAGHLASQNRVGIHQSRVAAKFHGIKNPVMLLAKLQRTPPVLIMFRSAAISYTAVYPMQDCDCMIVH